MNVPFKSDLLPVSLAHCRHLLQELLLKLVLVVPGTVNCASAGWAWHLSPVTSFFCLPACACPKASLLLEECCSMALQELGRPWLPRPLQTRLAHTLLSLTALKSSASKCTHFISIHSVNIVAQNTPWHLPIAERCSVCSGLSALNSQSGKGFSQVGLMFLVLKEVYWTWPGNLCKASTELKRGLKLHLQLPVG